MREQAIHNLKDRTIKNAKAVRAKIILDKLGIKLQLRPVALTGLQKLNFAEIDALYKTVR